MPEIPFTPAGSADWFSELLSRHPADRVFNTGRSHLRSA